jgi:hypothetical protein
MNEDNSSLDFEGTGLMQVFYSDTTAAEAISEIEDN